MTYTIDESLNDSDFTAAGSVGGVFGTPRRYESITIHHWGSFGQTHDGVVGFFMKPNSKTSAHFVVSDSNINCLVSPQDATWAAGNAYGNATSIHIECRPEATEGDYATVAWLVRFLREHYGNLPLKPHSAWTATACPGRWDLGKVDRLARATAPMPPAKPAPSKPHGSTKPATKYEPDPHWVVDPGNTLGQIAKYYGVSVDQIAAFNGIKDPDQIKAGEWIWPPVGMGTWYAEKGDTVSKIVAWVRANWDKTFTQDDLCFANGINNPNVLRTGQRLLIKNR